MKHLLLFVTILISGPVLYAQAKLTPIQFNDKLTDITDSLYARGGAWGKHFQEVKDTKNFSSLRPYREGMQRFINNKIAEVGKMEDVNNSKPLRMAMVSFLRFELRMATEAFQPVERLNAASSNDDISKALEKLSEIAKGEEAELAKVAAAQEVYATENGFRIETEEEAKARDEK